MVKLVATFLLALLPAFVQAQTPSADEKVLDVNGFKDCGFISRYSPNKIPANCFQSVTNAYFDKDFSILRRQGYAKYNLTPCTGSQPIRGLWPFYATDGSQYIVAYSSSSMFASKGDGTCTPITGLSNLSATAQMECVQGLGKLWCANGVDEMFWTTVTATAAVTSAPIGPHIGFFRNRILVAGVPSNLTQLYMSGEIDGTDYTLPTVMFSTSPAIINIAGINDGLAVTCLMGEYQNQYLIGRKYDLYALGGYDNTNFTLRKVSNQIGCQDPKSVQEVNNTLMWLSYRGIEGYTGTQINRVSYPIDPTIGAIITAAGNTQSQTFTTQADFNTGNLVASGPGAPMSTTISPGNVVPSSWSITTGGLDASWAMTDVDSTTAVIGYVDNFDDGNITGNVTWTATPGYGVFSVDTTNLWVTGSTTSGGTASMSTPISNSTGTWSFVVLSTGSVVRFNFISDSVDPFLFNGYRISVQPLASTPTERVSLGKILNSGFTLETINSAIDPNIADSNSHYYRVSRAKNGSITVAVDGITVISTVAASGPTSGSYVVLASQDSVGSISKQHFSKIKFPYFYENQVSSIYNTGISTPTWGPYSISFSSVSISSISLSIQSSIVGDGSGFQVLQTQSANQIIVADKKKYIRHHIYPSPPESQIVSTVTAVNLSAETTGYYITPCITAAGNTGWGNLNANAVTNGGSLSFSMSTSAVSCAQVTDPNNANWTPVTANSIIPVPVSSYTAVRVLFSMDSATQVPILNDMQISWNAGASRPPVASSHHDDRYWLFYTTNSAVGSVNDHAVIYDQNQKWTLFDDINAYSAAEYLNQLYIGDSNSTGLIYQMNSGQDDNGNPFNYSFKTADMDDGDPNMLKTFERVYIMLTAGDTTTGGSVLSCNYAIDGSTTTYPLGSYTFGESPEQSGYAVAKMPIPAGQPSTGHWINFGCSYIGANGPVGVYQIRLVYTPQAWQ